MKRLFAHVCRISRTSLDRVGKVRARFIFYFESHVHAKRAERIPDIILMVYVIRFLLHIADLHTYPASSTKVFNVIVNAKWKAKLKLPFYFAVLSRLEKMQFLSVKRSHDISLQKPFLNREHLATFFAQFYDSQCVLSGKVSATNCVCVCARWLRLNLTRFIF